ncbi:hypothetical protein BGZ58_011311 [Dissophora ornata]|nr:hypothetical protein BGZ58_011311 [Dissophora ornata]
MPVEVDNVGTRCSRLLLLAHLRKVVLQDVATLVDLHDPDCDYNQHHIFHASVFKGELFYRFRNELGECPTTAASPIVEGLATNTPAIRHQFHSLNSRLSALDNRFDAELLRQPDQSTKCGVNYN